jgi:uncharacterized repeat protein (TIGR01451 family)
MAAGVVFGASNGAGVMTVNPTNLLVGATPVTLTFDFYNDEATFTAGSQVVLVIPAGWTAPTMAAGAGHITVVEGAGQGTNTCDPGSGGNAAWSIAGQTITIPMTCGTNDHLTITYSGVTAPAAGTYTFTTQSRDGAGALADITTSPTVTVVVPLTAQMYKEICPAYSDVPANVDPANLDDTGGHWAELNTSAQTVSANPATDLPAQCLGASGWTFDFMDGQGGNVIGTATTVGGGTVTVNLNADEAALARVAGGLWVDEETAASAPFGAIRCYDDLLNGDNLENIQNVPNTVGTIYCIAYNVTAPALSIAKVANPTTFSAVGQTITYTYTLTNSGNVTLTAPFSVSDDHAIYALSCSSAAIAPAASATCTASYNISQADLDAGFVTNSASGSATHGAGAVNTTVNATATVTTSSQNPALTIAKVANPTTFSAVGQTIVYTYTLTNSGNVTLTGPFSVSDDHAIYALSCSSAAIAPLASATCTASYNITQADINAGSVTNTASGSATYGAGAVNTTVNATATVTTSSQNPALSIAKVANPTTFSAVGQTIVYTYTLTNSGNVTLTGPFSVSDDHAIYALSCSSAAIAPLASATCTASYNITQADINAGSVTNSASGSATYGAGAVGTTVNATATVTANQSAHLSITKVASPTTFSAVDQVIGYTIVLTNDGNVTLTSPSVSDPLVSNLDCGTVPSSLAPGGTITCTASHTIVQGDINAGHWANTATGQGDFGAATITVTADVTVTATGQSAHLSITKTANRQTFAAVGDVIGYTIVLTNDGNMTLTNPSVGDPLVSDLDCGTLPSSLAPGGTITCTASHTIVQGDIDAGSVTNTASGQANSGETTITVTGQATTQHGTASPGHSATPPPTNTSSNPSNDGTTPLFALLICMAFGSLALVTVLAQRRSIRR